MAKYILVISILLLGIMAEMAIVENSYHRIDTICQEGC